MEPYSILTSKMGTKDHFKDEVKFKNKKSGLVTPLKLKGIVLCFLFYCNCFHSCNNREKNIDSNDFYIISIEKEIDNIIQSGLSEVGSSITYIPLQTTSESLIGGIGKIILTDSYIATGYDPIFLFDTSGRFIRQIGKRGQGPGEYTILGNYCFSIDGKKIYLLDSRSNCLEYNVEGKFLSSYQINSRPNKLLAIKENLFVFNSPNSSRDTIQHNLFLSDLQNNILRAYKNHHKATYMRGILVPAGNQFYSYQGMIRYKATGLGADTLFTVTEDEMKPYALFHLGTKQLPEEIELPNVSEGWVNMEALLSQMGHGGKYYVRDIFEDVNNLYLNLSDMNKNLYCYYNKSSNTVKVIGNQGFQNDIDGGLPFFPRYVYDDNTLVSFVDSYDLREHVLNGNATEMKRLYGQKYDDLVKLVNSLEEDANPIVILVKK